MKISVIGAGYVGLTTAACLAHIGHEVFCSENDTQRLANLQNGIMPIFEPHLEQIVCTSVQLGTLRFGCTEEAIALADAVFICVGTPPLPNGDADLSAIEQVASLLAKYALGNPLVIEKSTVPVETSSRLEMFLSARSLKGQHYDVVSNPEFLREGSAVEDFLHPDRIVVGLESLRAETLMREIYAPVVRGTFNCPIHLDCLNHIRPKFLVTDTKSAELIKHASNSFLAMKISFVNMVADLCEVVGADVSRVSEGMGLDPPHWRGLLETRNWIRWLLFPKGHTGIYSYRGEVRLQLFSVKRS